MKDKNKNTILLVAGIIILIGIVALIAFSKGNSKGNNKTNQSAYSASILKAVEDRFDFGTIAMNGGNVSHQFEIKNEGEEPVKIEKVYTSCMCTTAYITDKAGQKYGQFGMPGHNVLSKTHIEIKAGETATVEAIFDPTAHGPSGIGLNERAVYLETNSKTSPKVELRFVALVTN